MSQILKPLHCTSVYFETFMVGYRQQGFHCALTFFWSISVYFFVTENISSRHFFHSAFWVLNFWLQASPTFIRATMWIPLMFLCIFFLQNVVGVTIGGTLGHALCTGLAVIGGRLIAQRISVRTGTSHYIQSL